MDEQTVPVRVCVANKTGDLRDCDCGYVSMFMKIRISEEHDGHQLHTQGRLVDA